MFTIVAQTGLFIWFIFSLFFVAFDKTMSIDIKIFGEAVNILSLGLIAANLLDKKPGVEYFIIVAFLLIWYVCFTPVDINNPGYGQLEKFVYVAIDFTMIIYLTACIMTKRFFPQLVHFDYSTQLIQIKNLKFFWI